MNVETPAIILAAADNEGKGVKRERSPLPFENALRNYLHGSISRETAERILRAEKPRRDGRFLVRVRATEGACRTRVQEDGSVKLLLSGRNPAWRSPDSSPLASHDSSPTASQSRGSAGSGGGGGGGSGGSPLERVRRMSCGMRGDSMTSLSSGMYGPDSGEPHSRRPSIVDANFEIGPKDSFTKQARLAASQHFEGRAGSVHARRSSVDSVDSYSRDVDGSYFLSTDDTNAPNQYVLSVIFQGRVTHHLLRRNYVSAPFQVNKLQTMATTLEDLVAGLAHPTGPWPVELREPVAPLEDAVELQYESNKLSAQGKFREAFFGLDKALESLRRTERLFPAKAAEVEHDLALTHDMCSNVYFSKADYEAALSAARAALQYEPVWFKPYITIGKCYSATERPLEAIASYKKALTLIPPGHVKELQCEHAVQQLTRKVDMSRRRQSRAASMAVAMQRRRSRSSVQEPSDVSDATATTMVYSEHLADEAIWYCLARDNARRHEACVEAASFLFDTTPADFASSCPVSPFDRGPENQRKHLEALAAAHVLPEASGDGKPLPRCPQDWKQWFDLRMDEPINMLQPTSGQATATAMYSWVLTALNIMQHSPSASRRISGRRKLHVVTDTPLEGYSALELCGLCPDVAEWTVVEVRPGETQEIQLVCDGMLPVENDDAPAQRLCHVVCSGGYNELAEAHPKLMADPDLVLFIIGHQRFLEGGESVASVEDALHRLDKAGTTVALTQTSWADHDAAKAWLSQQLLSTVPCATNNINPFAALVPHSEMPPVDNDPYAKAEPGMLILGNEMLGADGCAGQVEGSASSSLSRPGGSRPEAVAEDETETEDEAEDEDDSASMIAACAAIERAIADAERLEELEAAGEGDSRGSSPAPYAPMFSPRRAPSTRDEATSLPVPTGTAQDPVYLTADGYTSLGGLDGGAAAESDYATAAQVGLDAESDGEEDAGASSEYVDVASGMTPEARGRLTAAREEEPKRQCQQPQPLLHASAEGCANAFVLILGRPQRRR